MFSKGQMMFAGFFVTVFIIAMIYAYRKDSRLHKLFYKGNFKILIGFALFIVLLFVIKIFLKDKY